MKPDSQTVQEENFAVLLEAFDNALKHGQTPVVSAQSGAAAVRPRLEAHLACLRLLNQVRPGQRAQLSAEASGVLFGPAHSASMVKDEHVGTQLGKYLITKRLGQGGMGVVYEAQDTLMRRKVALKLLTGTLALDPAARERFLREARAAGRLNHPNVVTIFEVSQHNSDCYLVMELVSAGSAQDVLQELGQCPWQQANRMIADVCRGLAAAHAAGLLHRDIKPANILLNPDGSAKLADFGLAKLTEHGVTTLTAAGAVLGTPAFMSPEQCRSQAVDERSDLYSLGATYYALLTGQPPYHGDGPMEVMFAHCSSPIPDPRTLVPQVPESCVAIVQRALAKDASQRFASAAQMMEALAATQTSVSVMPVLHSSRASLVPSAQTPFAPIVTRPVLPQGRGTRLPHPRLWIGMGAITLLASVLVGWLLVSHLSVPAPTRSQTEPARITSQPPIPVDVERNIAQRMLKFHGKMKIVPRDGSGPLTVGKLGDLPKQPFSIEEIDLGTWETDTAEVTDATLEGLQQLKQLRTLYLTRVPISAQGMKHLQGLSQLTDLAVCSPSLSDQGLKYVGSLSALQDLGFCGCSYISDDGLKHLERLTQLRNLFLDGTRVVGPGLQSLQGLKGLEQLALKESAITDQGLKFLTGMKQLRWLALSKTAVSDVSLEFIKDELSQLKILDLVGCARVTDTGLVHLQDMTALTELFLTDTSVTDSGLANLKRLTNLQKLRLDGTSITDLGLQHLQGLSKLRELHLGGTKVSDAGVEELHQLLSECMIQR